MKGIKYIVVIATLGFMPFSLHAMSLYYDFSGSPGGSIANSRMFTDGGIALNVTAQQIDDTTNVVSDAYVSQNLNGGIGACSFTSGTDCNTLLDSTALDSVGPDEVLNFAITGGPIRLDSFQFTSYNLTNADRDNFIFIVDGVALNGGFGFHASADTPWVVAVDFGEIIASTSFSIRAVSTIAQPSSFRILNMNATKLAEPGTLGMLLLGLASVGFIRRRKSH